MTFQLLPACVACRLSGSGTGHAGRQQLKSHKSKNMYGEGPKIPKCRGSHKSIIPRCAAGMRLPSSIMGSFPTERIFWWSVEPDIRFITWRPPSDPDTDTVAETVAWICSKLWERFG